MYPLDEPALEVPCGYCGQPAGAWCVRRSRTTEGGDAVAPSFRADLEWAASRLEGSWVARRD